MIVGGGGLICGYVYWNVGLCVNGEVVGGCFLIEMFGEVCIKVMDIIGVVGFVDVGNVYEESVLDFGEDLKIGVGVGFRYFILIGLFCIDVVVLFDLG